jgi:hypothetical protein
MDPTMPVCLYCKRQNRAFTSGEHVVPHSLGNDTLILPVGVVCDDCNNRKLAKVDQALQEFPLLKLSKALLGIRSKSGRYPPATLPGLQISSRQRGNVHLKFTESAIVHPEPDGVRFTLPNCTEPDPKELRRFLRALFKIGLALVYLDEGPEQALSERYDPVRRRIVGADRERFHGFLLLGAQSAGRIGGRMQRFPREMDGRPLTLLGLDILGVNVVTELELGEVFTPVARELASITGQLSGAERWIIFEC